MHQAVRDIFRTITIPLEADFTHMYRDVLGYVTVAIGQKIDPLPAYVATDWAWIKGNGLRASTVQVENEWARIKAGPTNSGNTGAASKIATLHLETPERNRIFYETVDEFEKIIISQFKDWEQWPANAQLAALSMAWNFGPNLTKGWPTLAAKLKLHDWLYASDNCTPKVGPSARSRQNRILFTQAELSKIMKRPVDQLFDPHARLSFTDLMTVRSDTFSATSWWVQRMMIDAGDYPAADLDGLFGPVSRRAFGTMIITTLKKLSDATLRVMIIL